MNARRYSCAVTFRRGPVAAQVLGDPTYVARSQGNYMQTRRARLGPIIAACLCMIAYAQGTDVQANEASASASTRYVTFFVMQGNSSGITTVDAQLKTHVQTALTNKGFVEASPEDAQTVVVLNTATPARHSRDAFYQGWGGWDWWHLADTRAANRTNEYKVGTVVVDMFDAWTKTLLWHGSAFDGTMSRSSARASVRRHTAARIFRNFPFGGAGFGDGDSSMASDQLIRIIFSPMPALLIRIDGEPTYEQVTGTGLQRVMNTTALIVRDVAGTHYLRRGDTWMEAYDLTGSWSPAGTVPDGAEVALNEALSDKRTDLFASGQSHGPMPVVCVSTTPAALIVTDGEPEYAAFNGTPLLYIRNTTGRVFREPTDQELYVQVPAGWFRAWTTNGPWEPVPQDKLPADLPRNSNLTRTPLQIP